MSDVAERQAWIEITRLLICTLLDLAPQQSANNPLMAYDVSLEISHLKRLLGETAHKQHLSKKYLNNGAFEEIFHSSWWI